MTGSGAAIGSLGEYQREAMLEWIRILRVDGPHLLQVARLALQIFDQTGELHGQGPEARRWLEAGALLHDVGFFTGDRRHHKHSRDLILEQQFPGFSQTDTEVVACLARYHRGAVPSPRHALFAGLDEDVQRSVGHLAAILRVADALDRSHNARIHHVDCRIDAHAVHLHLVAIAEIPMELEGLEKKGGYFEQLFGRRLLTDFSMDFRLAAR